MRVQAWSRLAIARRAMSRPRRRFWLKLAQRRHRPASFLGMPASFTLVVAAPKLELAQASAFFDPITGNQFVATPAAGGIEQRWSAHRCQYLTLEDAVDGLRELTSEPVHVTHTDPDAALIFAAVETDNPEEFDLWHRQARDLHWQGPGTFPRVGLRGHSDAPMADFGLMCHYAQTIGKIRPVEQLTNEERRQFVQLRLAIYPPSLGPDSARPTGPAWTRLCRCRKSERKPRRRPAHVASPILDFVGAPMAKSAPWPNMSRKCGCAHAIASPRITPGNSR